MASHSIFLLCIFLVVATKVFSYDEDLKTVVPAPAPPVKAPTPAPPVKSPSYPPGSVTTPPTVKVPPPPQSPLVKPPTPTPAPVKVPPPQPPVVKPPTPTPPLVYPPPPPVAPSPPAHVVKSKKDCIPLCDYRCSLHSRKRLCMRACMTCCDRCRCVPPGTYGNREKCGKCYTDMLTHGNKFKCP